MSQVRGSTGWRILHRRGPFDLKGPFLRACPTSAAIASLVPASRDAGRAASCAASRKAAHSAAARRFLSSAAPAPRLLESLRHPRCLPSPEQPRPGLALSTSCPQSVEWSRRLFNLRAAAALTRLLATRGLVHVVIVKSPNGRSRWQGRSASDNFCVRNRSAARCAEIGRAHV